VGKPASVRTPDLRGDSVSLPNNQVDAKELAQAFALGH
jgi:hypothetical protein